MSTTNRSILIDGTHPEETRVVVMTDDQLEEFEFESAHKDSSRGNVYVGEITRVEPSLQAAFISYGGNRNGFLAFSEIHPDYYDLPEDEKKQLLEEFNTQSVAVSKDDDADDKDEPKGKKAGADSNDDDDADADNGKKTRGGRRRPQRRSRTAKAKTDENISDDAMKSARERVEADASAAGEELTPEEIEENARALAVANAMAVKEVPEEEGGKKAAAKKPARRGRPSKKDKEAAEKAAAESDKEEDTKESKDAKGAKGKGKKAAAKDSDSDKATDKPETQPRRLTSVHRRYKMDEVIKAGQKVLVQIVKEERGTKGAALTTYVSLPGRFVVLMPNTPYAGGISRKITDGNDRRELKKITEKIEVPQGMGMIVRTAGVGQSEDSIVRDVEHLKDLWKKLSKSWEKEPANTLVHEDGSLLIRALRDMFTDEVDEVIVSGKGALKHAKDYMKSLMPEHAKKIKEYKHSEPIFAHYGVEMELHLLDRTRVNLPSGGYLIINPTEALVSIDVNSGRATQEKNIEATAVATNIEAAQEIARQLRLRDLAGLVVIDFIDMEDRRNDRKVERAMRDAVRRDRARTQIGNISDFGLMEMSRQRLHPSLGESNYLTCQHCQGKGLVRSPASAATIILRGLEEDDVRGKADRIVITANTQVAVYMLNYKRETIAKLEKEYKMRIVINADDKYIAPDHRLDLIRVSPDGSEKSQTIERSFREELDDSGRKRRRRKQRKGNDKRTRGSKQASNQKDGTKQTAKDDNKENNKRSRGSRGRGGRKAAPKDDSAKADNKPETKQASDAKEDSKPQEAASKKAASGKPAAKAKSKAEAPKPAAEAKAKKPKPVTKPLMVEKIGADDKDAIAKQAQDDKKKSVLQRWWNK